MGKKFTESKAFNIILSLLIAVGLWAYVTVSVGEEKTRPVRDIPVTVVGEDVLNAKGLMIDPSSDLHINMSLTGSLKDLTSIAANISDYFSITANVAEIAEPGTYKLPCNISSKNTLFSTSVRQTVQESKTVTVVITKLMSKNIDVKGVFAGTVDVDNDYRSNPPEITPGTISIRGPESLVNQVAYAQVTIQGETLTKTFSGELGFELMTADGRVIKSDDITTDVDAVNVVLPVVKVLKEVPLAVEYIYGGGITEDNFDRYVDVHIEPETIQISGDESAILPLVGQEKIVGKINLSEVVKEKTYTFPITLDPQLSNDSGINQATVTVTVKGLETKVVTTTNIEIINKPAGFSVDAVTQSLEVAVRGPAEALESVEGYQIRAVVDMSLEENPQRGQFPLTPRIYLDGGDSKCGVISRGDGGNGDDKYRVVVNIQPQ